MTMIHPDLRLRSQVKGTLAALGTSTVARGASLLIYHRIGAGTRDELDVPTNLFQAQLDILEDHDVVALDEALDRIQNRDAAPSVVLTFDDGFADMYENAWPLLRERRLPFTIYLATAFMGERMRWAGSTARGEPGMGLTWTQLDEMLSSGLLTVGNHTHNHVPPEDLTVEELDLCTDVIERNLGVRARHFTYPWGVPVAAMESALRARFRSSSTGTLGRNDPTVDTVRLNRIPVRQSDPIDFFNAKLSGGLLPERVYGRAVAIAKMPARLRTALRELSSQD